jgi:uncharacterized membrane protein YfcA
MAASADKVPFAEVGDRAARATAAAYRRSSKFSWLDVSFSTAAMFPVVLGMYAGQYMRDKIAPETFSKLVLIAVIAAGAELVRHGFFG